MSSPRYQARMAALQLLYRYDHSDQMQVTEALASMAKDLHDQFEHFNVSEDSREFAAELVTGALIKRQELDALIEKHASNWKVPRMSLIDRNLLRMATFELQSHPEIPVSVTLNEAVELAKRFGTADSAAFINGVLDQVAKTLRGLDTSK